MSENTLILDVFKLLQMFNTIAVSAVNKYL
jgi:hypothetical protein